MIDFGCKRFELESIIKCALGLTRIELTLFFHLLDCHKEIDAKLVAKTKKIDITTVQKAFKKFHEKDIIERKQVNLESGGYVYVYTIKSKRHIESVIISIIDAWSNNVKKELRHWKRSS